MASSLNEDNLEQRQQQPPPTMPRTISFKSANIDENTLSSAEILQDISKPTKIKKKATSSDDSNRSYE